MSLPRRARSSAKTSFAGFSDADIETIQGRLGRAVDPIEARRFVLRLQANVERVLRLPWLDRKATEIVALGSAADRDAMSDVADAASNLRVKLDRLHRPEHDEALKVLRDEWSRDVPIFSWDRTRRALYELEELAVALSDTSGRKGHRPKHHGVAELVVQALAFAWLDTWGTAPKAKGQSTRFVGLVSILLEVLSRRAPHLAMVLRTAPHHEVITRLVEESAAAHRDGASFDPAVFLTR